MNRKWLKENAFFCILLLLAAFLRLAPLDIYQFSHDELSALSRTVFSTLAQEIKFGVQYTDTHPLLIQVFLFYWVKLGGFSEAWVKLPFLLCGIGSVWAIYRFTKQWFGMQAALYAQLIAAASFIFVLYSSYVRMYAPGVLFSVLLLHYLFNILFAPKPARRHFILFGLFCLLCAFNNHLNALFAFTAALAGLLLLPKKAIVPYLLTCLGVVICYLPHLPITLTQLQTGGLGTQDNGWLPPPKATVLFDFLKVLFGTGIIGLCVWIAALLVVIAHLAVRRQVSKKQLLLLVLFLLNYGIIHLYSVFRSPVLQYSVLLFAAPCLLVFIASFHELLQRRLFYGLSVCIVLALSGEVLVVKDWMGSSFNQSYETMVRQCVYESKLSGSRSVTGVFAAEPFFIDLYNKKYNLPLSYNLSSSPEFADARSTRAYFKSLPASIEKLVLGDATPRLVALAQEQFPYITSHRQGYFYNVLTLSRGSRWLGWDTTNHAPVNTWLLTGPGLLKPETPAKPVNGTYTLDSTMGEFPFACKAPYASLHMKEGQWLMAEVAFEADTASLSPDDLLCFSINMSDSTKNYFTAAHFAEFMQPGASVNKLYLQLFSGSDTDVWNKSGDFACFVWKKPQSQIRLKSAVLKQIDYNPSKWRLWE